MCPRDISNNNVSGLWNGRQNQKSLSQPWTIILLLKTVQFKNLTSEPNGVRRKQNSASIFSEEAASLPSLNSVVVVIWCRQQVWLWFFIGFIVSCLKPLGYGFIFFVFVGKMSNFVGTLAIVFLLLLRLLCSVNAAATHLIFKWSHLPKRTSLKNAFGLLEHEKTT